MELQQNPRLQDSTPPDRDSGTESDESAKINRDSDGSLSSESDDERETRHGKSGGNQSITVHAPTTVVMNNISTTTISRGCGRQSVHGQMQVPSDIASGRHQSPFQPMLKFPGRSFGSGRPRSFNSGWNARFPWIEYSAERDAAFCYPCRLFYVGVGRGDNAFTHVGFRDWKHAMGKRGIISAQDNCSSHKQAMACWNEYTINLEKHTSVAHRLETAREQVVKTNRHYIKTLIEILLLCAKQEIAVRGHRESAESRNQGNFLEILKLVADHDAVIKEKIRDNPHNATYTSPDIQNQLLEVMGGLVRGKVCKAVQDARYYSLLGDETEDVSKVEQLAIVLRYVDVQTATIYERFLTYVPAESLTAESLAMNILTTLRNYQLDPKYIVSQGYDGASVMSGNCTGVQTRIREVAPQAIYVHCNAHCLNLCLVDSTKAICEASEFFASLETVYSFIII